MNGYLVSLLMGIAVRVIYGLVQVRSPAPPLIALAGLLGMVLGEQAIDLAKRHIARPVKNSAQQAIENLRGHSLPVEGRRVQHIDPIPKEGTDSQMSGRRDS